MKVVEDPSIAWCASVEFDRVWQRIEEQCANGAWFFKAREQVLAEEVPFLAKRYGKAVANRVSRTVESKGPVDLSKATKRGEAAAMRAWEMAGLPPLPRAGPFGRFMIRLFG